MLWLKHISGILGRFTSFLPKKIVLLIILLPLDKILRFFCVVYLHLYLHMYSIQNHSTKNFFQKIWVNLLVLCVLRKCV